MRTVGNRDGRTARQGRLTSLRVHPAARREIDDAFDWCKAKYGRRVAARLLRRFELAGQMLMREPGLGTPAPSNARTLPLSDFPYTLIYQVEGAHIHVIALMHQSRLPDYWTARLPG